MSTIIHFINVGQGNMVLVQTDSGKKFVFDCNITDKNEDRVLQYVADQIGWNTSIYAFICSHRDADHIRGIKKLHSDFPIREIWDSDYPGTTTDTSEYRAYMDLRRTVGAKIINKKTRFDFGRTRLRILSSKDDRLPKNANAQGIVIKAEHRSVDGSRCLGSAILPGDSDAATWRYGIYADYSKNDTSASILMAAHHGSISFFDDPDDKYYYKDHINAIKPAMTIVSVGDNAHGHPNETALKFYREGSSGSSKGNKVYRTDRKGTMKLTLKDGGGWLLNTNQ